MLLSRSLHNLIYSYSRIIFTNLFTICYQLQHTCINIQLVITTPVKHGIIITFSILHTKKRKQKSHTTSEIVLSGQVFNPISFGPYPVSFLGIFMQSDRLFAQLSSKAVVNMVISVLLAGPL